MATTALKSLIQSGRALTVAALAVVLAGQATAQNSPQLPNAEPPPGAGSEGAGAEAIPPGQDLVNIDFPEPTEIKDIIRAVALWTGKNVLLDRNVNGKVQIISPKRVTKEEAYQAFLSALNMLGLTTVETGKVIKIMPVRNAVKGNLKTFLGRWTPMTDETITQIVPLKYIDAKEIQSTLSRIVKSNSMIAYPPTNTLIISDSGYNVKRILDILDLIDVQGQQPQVAIVPIRYAEAKGIAEKVREIFKTGGGGGGKKGGGGGGYNTYKIMTDERTNSVVIFGPPRTISDVKELVRKFDTRLDDPSRQSTIHVRPLDYADAKKLASTLSALAGSSSSSARRPPVRRPNNRRNNNRNNTASEAPAVAQLDGNIKITADEPSNSLLITGSHAAYRALNSIIRKLDMRRSQVFVESDILDINMGSAFNFETGIFGGQGGPGESSIATTWEASNLAPLVVAQSRANAGTTSTSTTQIEQVAGVFAEDLTIGVIGGEDVTIDGLGTFRPGALIRMIKNDGNTRIVSSPHLLTSNNEEAQITVGERLFFSSPEVAPQTGVVTNKIEKEDADLTLAITPNVSHSNYVTLQIDLESSTATLDPQTNLPNVKRRQTKQIVTVKNGQTVVISGLVQTTENETFGKIPFLGDIPIVGWLFRNTRTQQIRTNLMIFLTPHIIHGADDLAAVYKEKIQERDQFLAAVYGSGYQDDDFYASLPSLEDGLYQPDAKDDEEKRQREAFMNEVRSNNTGNSAGGFLSSGSGDSMDGGGDYGGAVSPEPPPPVETAPVAPDGN